MKSFLCSLLIILTAFAPFGIALIGAVVAVFGKATMKFPFQPKESKTFRQWPTIPRMHSPIYVIKKPPTHRR